MTRLDPRDAEAKSTVALEKTIRQDVRAELRSQALRKRIRGCCGCLLVNLVVLVVFASLIAFAIAKTGLVRVPLFSRFYEAPRPVRYVAPLNRSFGETVASLVRSSRDGTVRLVISEGAFTRLVQDQLREVGWLDSKTSQIIVSPDGIEVFAPIAGSEERTAIRFRLMLQVREGMIEVRVKQVILGELPLWPRPIDALADSLFDQFRKPFESVEVTGLNLEIGEVKIRGTVK